MSEILALRKAERAVQHELSYVTPMINGKEVEWSEVEHVLLDCPKSSYRRWLKRASKANGGKTPSAWDAYYYLHRPVRWADGVFPASQSKTRLCALAQAPGFEPKKLPVKIQLDREWKSVPVTAQVTSISQESPEMDTIMSLPTIRMTLVPKGLSETW